MRGNGEHGDLQKLQAGAFARNTGWLALVIVAAGAAAPTDSRATTCCPPGGCCYEKVIAATPGVRCRSIGAFQCGTDLQISGSFLESKCFCGDRPVGDATFCNSGACFRTCASV